MTAVAIEDLARRTDAGPCVGIVAKIAGLIVSGLLLGLGPGFVVKRIGGVFVPVLCGKARIAIAAHVNVKRKCLLNVIHHVAGAIWPPDLRLSISLIGAIAVAAIHFWAGRELTGWVPASVGRAMGIAGIVALPVLLGTAAIILVSQPMSGTTVGARVAESTFWVFAALGALMTTQPQHRRESLELQWADGAVALVAILIVRLLVRGIPFVP